MADTFFDQISGVINRVSQFFDASKVISPVPDATVQAQDPQPAATPTTPTTPTSDTSTTTSTKTYSQSEIDKAYQTAKDEVPDLKTTPQMFAQLYQEYGPDLIAHIPQHQNDTPSPSQDKSYNQPVEPVQGQPTEIPKENIPFDAAVDPRLELGRSVTPGSMKWADVYQVLNTTFGKDAPNFARVLAWGKYDPGTGQKYGKDYGGENQSYNPKSENTNKDGSTDRGLFQINSNTFKDLMSRNKAELKTLGISSYDDMFDPAKNAAVAKIIYDEGGFSRWYGAPPDLVD